MSVTISSILLTVRRSISLRPTALDTTFEPSSHRRRRPEIHEMNVSRTTTTAAVTNAGVWPANSATTPPSAAPSTTAPPTATQPRRRALANSVRLSGTRSVLGPVTSHAPGGPARAGIQLEEEPVRGALAADGRAVAVAGQDDGVVGEREDLVTQGLGHRAHVAAGEVGAADGAGEQCVAGEHHAPALLQRRMEDD